MRGVLRQVAILLLFQTGIFLSSQAAGTAGAGEVGGVESGFKAIVIKYTNSEPVADSLWNEAVRNYTGPTRFYHTLEHLDNFYRQLNTCREMIADWDALVIAMVYHDIIYGSADHQDEGHSAELAVQRLSTAGFPEEKVEKIRQLILATKSHALSEDMDTNYFIDADMSILGLDRAYYQRYVVNVRKEYANVPGFDMGRKKVLQYFLGMPAIFKTEHFKKRYEAAARENIQWEISTLP